MKRMLLLLLLVPTLLSFAGASVHAQPAAPTPPQVEGQAVTHNASITLSPVHLAIGMVEVTSEFRLGDQIGLAGTLGGGQVLGVSVFEVGAQFVYYLSGSFDGGVHLGAEAQWLSAFRDSGDAQNMSSATAEGLAIGSMLGYKWVGDSGLSLVAQGGAQYIGIQAKAESGSATATKSDAHIAALINLNAGWSF